MKLEHLALTFILIIKNISTIHECSPKKNLTISNSSHVLVEETKSNVSSNSDIDLNEIIANNPISKTLFNYDIIERPDIESLELIKHDMLLLQKLTDDGIKEILKSDKNLLCKLVNVNNYLTKLIDQSSDTLIALKDNISILTEQLASLKNKLEHMQDDAITNSWSIYHTIGVISLSTITVIGVSYGTFKLITYFTAEKAVEVTQEVLTPTLPAPIISDMTPESSNPTLTKWTNNYIWFTAGLGSKNILNGLFKLWKK